eukprot:153308-Chlamydomonas_euryale.AAC.1
MQAPKRMALLQCDVLHSAALISQTCSSYIKALFKASNEAVSIGMSHAPTNMPQIMRRSRSLGRPRYRCTLHRDRPPWAGCPPETMRHKVAHGKSKAQTPRGSGGCAAGEQFPSMATRSDVAFNTRMPASLKSRRVPFMSLSLGLILRKHINGHPTFKMS